MLRITRRPDRGLDLEGRLTRYEVGLLRETVSSADAIPAHVDLSGIGFLDEAGAAALVELGRRGLELRGGSSFVRRLLEEVSS